jgi:hypothetical protein
LQLKGGCTHQRQQTATKARSSAAAAKTKYGLTIPTPFALATELRGKLHEDQFKSKVVVEDKENAQAHLFKAHPVPKVLDHPTGVPPITHRPPLTAVQPFALRSEVGGRHCSGREGRSKAVSVTCQRARTAAMQSIIASVALGWGALFILHSYSAGATCEPSTSTDRRSTVWQKAVVASNLHCVV